MANPTTPTGITKTAPSSSSGNTIPTFRVSGVASGNIVKLYSGGSCGPEIGSVVSTGTTADITPTFMGDSAYDTFSTKAFDYAGNVSGCFSSSISYTLDTTAPSAPNGVALVTGSSNATTKTLRVSGVSQGDTVELYISGSNKPCETLVNSGTVGSGNNTIDIATSSLSGNSYAFYAKAKDSLGNTSSCSTAFFNYRWVLLFRQTVPICGHIHKV